MINLFKYYWIYFAISLFFLVPGIFFMLRGGIQPAIDFTGGSLIEVRFVEDDNPNSQAILQTVEQFVDVSSVQGTGESSVVIRTKEIDNATKDQIIRKLGEEVSAVEELRFETVGPVLGKELLIKTVLAVLIVAGVIMFYVMKQFSELKYGISAIVAMFHDTLILFGAFAFLGLTRGVEIDVLFVTAVLTTLSFSIHDTIVVFDRIRELRHKSPKEPLKSLADIAVKQTLTRSFNNSMTIIIMLLALALLGGESIRWFVVALLIGAVTGTYSSTFTAVPILMVLEDFFKKKKK